MVEMMDINNELICMKKTIQRAKVCVINKLVKKLREIKVKLEKDPKNFKLNNRSQKYNEQISYTKCVNNLELAKLVLTTTKTPIQVLTNPASSVDDVVLAHISLIRSVQEKVKEIIEKFNLKDVPDWRENINKIGKKKKKKITKEENKQKNTVRKEEKKKIRDENQKRTEWLEENLDIDDISKITTMKVDGPLLKKNKEISKQPIIIKKTFNKNFKKPEKPKVEKLTDSFFITGSGENYLATAVAERTQLNIPGDGLDRRRRRAQQFGKELKLAKTHQKNNINDKCIPNTKNKISISSELHPSWSAKQKMKIIHEFKGTKITFDEEPLQSVTTERNNEIHPSWVAKQKQKPIISEFKGTKITFDD